VSPARVPVTWPQPESAWVHAVWWKRRIAAALGQERPASKSLDILKEGPPQQRSGSRMGEPPYCGYSTAQGPGSTPPPALRRPLPGRVPEAEGQGMRSDSRTGIPVRELRRPLSTWPFTYGTGWHGICSCQAEAHAVPRGQRLSNQEDENYTPNTRTVADRRFGVVFRLLIALIHNTSA
jgi:hypothetical protein